MRVEAATKDQKSQSLKLQFESEILRTGAKNNLFKDSALSGPPATRTLRKMGCARVILLRVYDVHELER